MLTVLMVFDAIIAIVLIASVLGQEAKSAGYDLPGLRLAIREQRETAEQRRKREAAEQNRDLILAALGEFATTPLGQAAAG